MLPRISCSKTVQSRGPDSSRGFPAGQAAPYTEVTEERAGNLKATAQMAWRHQAGGKPERAIPDYRTLENVGTLPVNKGRLWGSRAADGAQIILKTLYSLEVSSGDLW